MRKVFFLILVVIGSVFTVDASHLMGGQIVVTHLNGMDYIVKYTNYRDMAGIPNSTNAILTFTNSAAGIQFDSILTPGLPDTLSSIVEELTYQGVVTFPVTGDWTVSFHACCRNAGILNFYNSYSTSLYFYSNVLVDSANSTPEFLNPPIVVGQLGVPFFYNPLPVDIDGDSIAWQLIVPLEAGGVPVSGYVLPSSDSLYPFRMDSITGEISFLPNTIGEFEFSFRVLEFRNGVQIGEIMRDMRVIIDGSGNLSPILTTNSNIYPNSGKNFTIAPNAGFTYSLTINDPDNNSEEVTASGEPFLSTNAPVLTSVNQSGIITLTLNWTPDATRVRTKPYIIGLSLSENVGYTVFKSDFSLSLQVGLGTTGITTPLTSNDGIAFYPNPTSNDQVTFQMNAESTSPVTLKFYNLNGQVVKELNDVQIALGDNLVLLRRLELKPGAYLIQATQDGANFKPVRLVIQ